MPPELWAYAQNNGLATVLVVYGLFVFHNSILPELKAHFSSVAQMTEAIKTAAGNTTENKVTIEKIDGKVDELLVRIPHKSRDHKEAS